MPATTTATDPKTQKRVNTVKKLLRQASHPGTGHLEAENFFAHAQQMIEQFNISEAMLAEEKPGNLPDEICQRVIYNRNKGKMPTWLLQLARGVAIANRVRLWYSSSRWHGTISAAGTEANLTSCQLLIPFLVGEVDRLYQEEKPCWLNRSEGRRWGNSFRLGCASRIAQRLRQALKAAEQAMREDAKTPTPEARYKEALAAGDTEALLEMDRNPLKPAKYALAKVETALARLKDEKRRADVYVDKHVRLGKGTARNHYGSSSTAFAAGRDAGSRASLSGPKGQIRG